MFLMKRPIAAALASLMTAATMVVLDLLARSLQLP